MKTGELIFDAKSNSNSELKKMIANQTRLLEKSMQSTPDMHTRVTSFDYGIDSNDSECISAAITSTTRRTITPGSTKNKLHHNHSVESSVPLNRSDIEEDDANALTRTETFNTVRSLRIFYHPFENILRKTRVYSRNILRHDTSSFLEVQTAKSSWSQLTGVSLSAISSVSVIMLPISKSEVENTTFATLFQSTVPVTELHPSAVSTTYPYAMSDPLSISAFIMTVQAMELLEKTGVGTIMRGGIVTKLGAVSSYVSRSFS
jgi:hypothetical protein